MGDATDSLGWQYRREPDVDSKDCRHLVALSQDGMRWIGIRAWHVQDRCWYNGNEPERAEILAFMPLPEMPRRFWWRGQLQSETRDEHGN